MTFIQCNAINIITLKNNKKYVATLLNFYLFQQYLFSKESHIHGSFADETYKNNIYISNIRLS